MKKVVIYTTPTCTYCKQTKDFFKENSISYEEYDVASDMDKRKEMVEKSGQMGVPVIFVDDQMFVGFDKEGLSQALGL